MKIAGLFLAAALAVSAGCSKIPESESARQAGAQPKQVIDKATAEVNKSLQSGAEARQDAESRPSDAK